MGSSRGSDDHRRDADNPKTSRRSASLSRIADPRPSIADPSARHKKQGKLNALASKAICIGRLPLGQSYRSNEKCHVNAEGQSLAKEESATLGRGRFEQAFTQAAEATDPLHKSRRLEHLMPETGTPMAIKAVEDAPAEAEIVYDDQQLDQVTGAFPMQESGAEDGDNIIIRDNDCKGDQYSNELKSASVMDCNAHTNRHKSAEDNNMQEAPPISNKLLPAPAAIINNEHDCKADHSNKPNSALTMDYKSDLHSNNHKCAEDINNREAPINNMQEVQATPAINNEQKLVQASPFNISNERQEQSRSLISSPSNMQQQMQAHIEEDHVYQTEASAMKETKKTSKKGKFPQINLKNMFRSFNTAGKPQIEESTCKERLGMSNIYTGFYEEDDVTPSMLSDAVDVVMTALTRCAARLVKEARTQDLKVARDKRDWGRQLSECLFATFEFPPQLASAERVFEKPKERKRNMLQQYRQFRGENPELMLRNPDLTFKSSLELWIGELVGITEEERQQLMCRSCQRRLQRSYQYNSSSAMDVRQHFLRATLQERDRHPQYSAYLDFVELARYVWLLHLLAFASEPHVEIVRVPSTGSTFDPGFMESLGNVNAAACNSPDDPQLGLNNKRVDFALLPAFILRNSVIKARVYLVRDALPEIK